MCHERREKLPDAGSPRITYWHRIIIIPLPWTGGTGHTIIAVINRAFSHGICHRFADSPFYRRVSITVDCQRTQKPRLYFIVKADMHTLNACFGVFMRHHQRSLVNGITYYSVTIECQSSSSL